MKMRIMYYSKKGKMKAFADVLGKACQCQVNDIPPAYPADKERLVLIGASIKGEPSDELRRFCGELNSARANNVALFIDGPANSKGEQILKNTLKMAGTNVIDKTYYVKCGLFGKSVSAEEEKAIVDWANEMIEAVN